MSGQGLFLYFVRSQLAKAHTTWEILVVPRPATITLEFPCIILFNSTLINVQYSLLFQFFPSENGNQIQIVFKSKFQVCNISMDWILIFYSISFPLVNHLTMNIFFSFPLVSFWPMSTINVWSVWHSATLEITSTIVLDHGTTVSWHCAPCYCYCYCRW